MAYEKQGFKDWSFDADGNVVVEGTTLTAEHLKKLEEGIIENFTNIKYIESAVNDKPKVNWTDLESGNYVTYGYFSPYPNSNISISTDNNFVCVAKREAGTHVLCFDPLNAKVVFFEMLIDDTQPKGYAYTRKVISMLDLYDMMSGGGSACNVPRFESNEDSEEGLRNLRELDSGTYILHGYWNAYPGADTYMPFDNRLVTVEKQTAGSQVFVFETLNAKIVFHEILVDETAEDGFTHTETKFDLLDMHNKTSGLSGSARIGTVTLLAANWVGEANPYSQVVSIEGATENSQVDLTPSVEQLVIFHEKDLTFVTENEDGVVTVYAIGQKPENDYTIQVTITEVQV